MLFLANLEADRRKELHKLLKFNQVKKVNSFKVDVMKIFKKPITRVNEQEFLTYVECASLNPKDKIVIIYSENVERNIYGKYKDYAKLVVLIDNRTYEELDDETLEKIKELEKDYDPETLPITFEELVKISCVCKQETIYLEAIKQQSRDVALLRKEIEEADGVFEQEKNELLEEISQLKKDLKENKKKNKQETQEIKNQYEEQIKDLKEQLKSKTTKAAQLEDMQETKLAYESKIQQQEETFKTTMDEMEQKQQENSSMYEKQIEELEAQISDYKTSLEEATKKIEPTTIPLRQIIGDAYFGASKEEAYEELDRLEYRAIQVEDYQRTRYILAAKYALMKDKEEEGN